MCVTDPIHGVFRWLFTASSLSASTIAHWEFLHLLLPLDGNIQLSLLRCREVRGFNCVFFSPSGSGLSWFIGTLTFLSSLLIPVLVRSFHPRLGVLTLTSSILSWPLSLRSPGVLTFSCSAGRVFVMSCFHLQLCRQGDAKMKRKWINSCLIWVSALHGGGPQARTASCTRHTSGRLQGSECYSVHKVMEL